MIRPAPAAAIIIATYYDGSRSVWTHHVDGEWVGVTREGVVFADPRNLRSAEAAIVVPRRILNAAVVAYDEMRAQPPAEQNYEKILLALLHSASEHGVTDVK